MRSFVGSRSTERLALVLAIVSLVVLGAGGAAKSAVRGSGPPALTLATADLSVFMFDSRDPVSTGSALTYSVTVANDGPDAASSVAVSDVLPAGVGFVSATTSQGACANLSGTVTCALGTLAEFDSATIDIAVTGPSVVGQISNTVSVATADTDPDGTNNSSTETTEVVAPGTDLALSMFDSPDPAAVSGALTYTIDVENLGPDDATSATLTDTLPAA